MTEIPREIRPANTVERHMAACLGISLHLKMQFLLRSPNKQLASMEKQKCQQIQEGNFCEENLTFYLRRLWAEKKGNLTFCPKRLWIEKQRIAKFLKPGGVWTFRRNGKLRSRSLLLRQFRWCVRTVGNDGEMLFWDCMRCLWIKLWISCFWFLLLSADVLWKLNLFSGRHVVCT